MGLLKVCLGSFERSANIIDLVLRGMHSDYQ